MNTRFLFTHMPPGRLFLITAGPGAVGMLASVLFYMVDGIFIGRYLGETAFAALNLALPFVIINFSLSDLIGVGSSVPIAIKLGEKKNHTANNIFTCACVLTFLTSIGVGALLYFGGPCLLSLLGAKGELHALAFAGGKCTACAGLCINGACYHHCFRRRQLPAHLRANTHQYVP